MRFCFSSTLVELFAIGDLGVKTKLPTECVLM